MKRIILSLIVMLLTAISVSAQALYEWPNFGAGIFCPNELSVANGKQVTLKASEDAMFYATFFPIKYNDVKNADVEEFAKKVSLATARINPSDIQKLEIGKIENATRVCGFAGTSTVVNDEFQIAIAQYSQYVQYIDGIDELKHNAALAVFINDDTHKAFGVLIDYLSAPNFEAMMRQVVGGVYFGHKLDTSLYN